MTAEDPVEFNFEGINQVAVKPEIGLSFAAALRSFLRQDPDIIMVGEIRDSETAEIAIKAALTGHLVFSTLHTNDAPSSVTRLIDMGIPYYLVASATKLIMAQRMMKKICPKCKEEINLTEEQVESLRVPDELLRNIRAFRGKGCNDCNGTGKSGRTGIYEVMPYYAGDRAGDPRAEIRHRSSGNRDGRGHVHPADGRRRQDEAGSGLVRRGLCRLRAPRTARLVSPVTNLLPPSQLPPIF